MTLTLRYRVFKKTFCQRERHRVYLVRLKSGTLRFRFSRHLFMVNFSCLLENGRQNYGEIKNTTAPTPYLQGNNLLPFILYLSFIIYSGLKFYGNYVTSDFRFFPQENTVFHAKFVQILEWWILLRKGLVQTAR